EGARLSSFGVLCCLDFLILAICMFEMYGLRIGRIYSAGTKITRLSVDPLPGWGGGNHPQNVGQGQVVSNLLLDAGKILGGSCQSAGVDGKHSIFNERLSESRRLGSRPPGHSAYPSQRS